MAGLLDIRTLTLASGIIAVILFGYMVHLQLTRKTYPGFSLWTMGALAAGVGLSLVALRGVLPDLLTIFLANLLILAYPLLVYRGLASFVGRQLTPWPDAVLMLLYAAVIMWLTFGQPSVALRIIFFSILASYYCLRSSLLAARPVAALLGSRNWVLIFTLAGVAAFFLLRGLATLLIQPQPIEFMANTNLQVITFLVFFAGHILVTTGLVFLNIQRLELDLTSAQREVNLLNGLLPICAKCKRIRDDQGYWHLVEQYISTHSEATFSHGICPECIRELYPEISDKILGEEGSK